MRKPKYMTKLYALIFLCLGSAFLLMGFLCFAGIVKPTAHSSIQNPISLGTVFSLLGLALVVVQTIFRLISAGQDKSHDELLVSGTKLNGTVEKVYLQKYTQYGKKSPFRICYTYAYQDEIFHHKSRLLWDKPNFHEGDTIIVYVNDCGKSAISL